MNVLICDEDASIRHMVGRVLTHKFGAEFEEASNGLDALDKLQQVHFGALVMEARMPIMGGLETLQVLRESPQLARLPVMILTGERDERTLKQLVTLGVQDIILKPTNADRFSERFERMLNACSASDQSQPTGRATAAGRQLGHGAAALIADGDVQYREYFRKVAGSRFAITEAGSGARALEMCLKFPPDAVFLGTDLGVMGYERIVSRLRAIKSRRIRVFAIPTKSEAEAVRSTGLFDDVIVRTYVPALFEKELARLGQPLSAFIRFRELVPDVRTRVVSAVEQVLGTMLMTDVETEPASPFGEEARATSTITLTSAAFAITIVARIEMTAGREMAGAFVNSPTADLSEDDVLSVVGELTNVLAGRLSAVLGEGGIACVLGLPAVSAETAQTIVAPLLPEQGEDVHFRATDRPIHFQVTLTVEANAEAAGMADMDANRDVAILRAG